MKVKDVMTQHPICCQASDSVQTVAKALRDEDIGSVPIIADASSRRLIGIITDRDLCCNVLAEGLDPRTTSIEVYIKRNLVTCRADQSLDSCEKLMQLHQVRRLPVIDAEGRCIGMVSQADLARCEHPERVHKTIAEISRPARGIIVASRAVA